MRRTPHGSNALSQYLPQCAVPSYILVSIKCNEIVTQAKGKDGDLHWGTSVARAMGCTMAPLPGILDGMNEHGLTVTYNVGTTTDEPDVHAPLSMALQESLIFTRVLSGL